MTRLGRQCSKKKIVSHLNPKTFNLTEDLNDPLTEVWEIVEEKYRHDLCIDGPLERLGKRSTDKSRPRPLRVKFAIGTLQAYRPS